MWDGEYHYVHPSGWHEELPQSYVDCLEELFQAEPEMAAYIHGLSHMGHDVGPYPPNWHHASQMWVSSRDQPEPRLQYVARPLDCGTLIQGYYADTDFVSWGSQGETPDWDPQWGDAFGPGPPNSASDGTSRSSIARDGTITVQSTRCVRTSCQEWQDWSSPSQQWQDWGDWQDTCQQWQDWKSSEAAPPNPDRWMFHGRASAKRRAQRRELERKGEEVPEELKPRVHSLNKALKRQMYELHRKAREMAQEKDPAKLDEWEKQQADWLAIVAREDAERRAQEASSAKGSTRKSKASSASDGNGRERSKSVGTRLGKDGKPRCEHMPADGTLIQGGDEEGEEDEEDDGDGVPDQGKKKKNRRRSKTARGKKQPKEEKPDNGSQEKDPSGGKDGGTGGAGAAEPVAAP